MTLMTYLQPEGFTYNPKDLPTTAKEVPMTIRTNL